jgi:hypothetical protein
VVYSRLATPLNAVVRQMSRRRTCVRAVAVGWFVVGAAVGLFMALHTLGEIPQFGEEYERFDSAVEIGMSEAQVRANLGAPHLEYDESTAPEDYYVEGYARKRRSISSKVLIYKGVEPICYVWIDPSGKVEDYFIGGS